MGFAKWWLRHGPGSAGSVAKVMAKSYRIAKAQQPEESQDQLLLRTLRMRYPDPQVLPQQDAAQMVEDAEGSLAQLSLLVVHRGNPAVMEAAINAPDVFAEALAVIDEVTAQHVATGPRKASRTSRVAEGLLGIVVYGAVGLALLPTNRHTDLAIYGIYVVYGG